MDLLISCFLLFSYFNSNIAFEEEFIFNSSEFTNTTFLERGLVILNSTVQPKATDHTAIQIIIFAGCIILLILIGLLICSVCCNHIRRRHHELFTRSPSINSIQELIRERLLDRPPSYHESQSSLNTNHDNNPPTYNEIVSNTNIRVTESIANSTTRMPTSPPVYTISSKMSTTYANNDLDLPYAECESDTDSPPSYHNSEGVINPVLVHIVNNSPPENNTENHLHRAPNLTINSEFYI